MNDEIDMNKEADKERPPFFKTWTAWYALVLINLLTLIALFYWFTKTFE